MTKKTPTGSLSGDAVVVRWTTDADIQSQLDIERAWRHEKEDFWEGPRLADFLHSRSHLRGSIVAEHRIRGVVGHLQFMTREHDLALTNIAVHPAYCRLGVASRLVGVLATTLPSRYRRRRVNTVVRERNLAAQLFLKSAGYRCEGILDEFYLTPPDNGYHFQYLKEPTRRCRENDPRGEASPPRRS